MLLAVSIHQRNHGRLVSLRATTAALDAQIKLSLALLAATRKELLTSTPIKPIPPTASSPADRALEYAELLNYASRIARFTVPPTVRRPPPGFGGENEIKIVKQETRPSTPLLTPPAAPATPSAQGPVAPATQAAGAEKENKAVSALPDATKVWLHPTSSGVPFTPWPGNEVIRRGALAQIQATWDRGVDPDAVAGVLKGDGEEDELETRRLRELEERRDSLVENTRRRPAAASSKGGDEKRENQHAGGLLGFDLYDPDED